MRFIRTTFLTSAALAGALAIAGTASAATALPHPAGVIGGTVYTQTLAGYAGGSNGNVHSDDARATVTLPSQAETGAPIGVDHLVIGIAQQQSEVAASDTFGIGWVWDSSLTVSGTGCLASQYTLAYTGSAFTENPGTPVPPASLTPAQRFDPVTSTFGPVCANGGSTSYLELQYNSKTHQEHYFEGRAWNQKTLFDMDYAGYEPMIQVGVGVSTTTGAAAGALNLGSVASFTNARVTERTGKHANKPLDALNLLLYEGTLSGGAPSVVNPLTLTTTAITPAGSSFSVVAP